MKHRVPIRKGYTYMWLDKRSDAQKCADVRSAIEIIRRRKRFEHQEVLRANKQKDTRPGRFTQDNLKYNFSWYRRLIENSAKYPPPENHVRDMAGFLECDVTQLNILLKAAGYAPVEEFLTGTSLERALELPRYIMNYLPLPAYIVNRDWTIHDINTHAAMFFGITREVFFDIPLEERNILHFIFSFKYPFREMLAVDYKSWERTARDNILGFKITNQNCRFEPWYRKRVAMLEEIDGFSEIWNNIFVETAEGFPAYQSEIVRTVPATDNVVVLRFRTIQIRSSEYQEFPRVSAYLPQYKEDEQAFAAIGLAIP